MPADIPVTGEVWFSKDYKWPVIIVHNPRGNKHKVYFCYITYDRGTDFFISDRDLNIFLNEHTYGFKFNASEFENQLKNLHNEETK